MSIISVFGLLVNFLSTGLKDFVHASKRSKSTHESARLLMILANHDPLEADIRDVVLVCGHVEISHETRPDDGYQIGLRDRRGFLDFAEVFYDLLCQGGRKSSRSVCVLYEHA